MQQSDLFAYLSAFVTIVLALALSDLAMSSHRLARDRARVVWDSRPLLLALYAYLTVLSEFFALWNELDVPQYSYFELVGQMIVPVLISMLAFAALPDSVPDEGLDLGQFFQSERRYLIVLFLLLMVADTVRSLIWLGERGHLGDPRVWWWYGSLIPAFLAINFVLWGDFAKKWQVLAALALIGHAIVSYHDWAVEIA